MKRLLIAPLLFLVVMIFSSCIEGDEEIWINPDASGHLVSHYEIPSIALAQMAAPADMIRALRMIDEKEDGIKITALSFKVKGSKAIFHLEATFKDARKLIEIPDRNKELFIAETATDPKQMDAVAGIIEFQIKGLTPTFNRSVILDGLFPPMVSKRPKMLGRSNFKYTIHLPAKVKESNAHRVSEDGRTVSWTFSLKEHFEQPIQMSFTSELPIPWWAWAALGVLIFGLAWLIWQKILHH